jgi:hypothetical protein
MQTGQNSIAPESSLPQLGQVRWGSALMVLTALQSHPQPETTPLSTEWCEKRPAQRLANCCPVAQAIAYYLQYRVRLRFGTKFLPLYKSNCDSRSSTLTL